MLIPISMRSKVMSMPLLGAFVSLSKFSRASHYLGQTGWFNSSATYASVDADNNPIPWLTYSALDFLQPRVQKHFRVFEYGSGNSTCWWASRVAAVDAVENDRIWFKQVETMLQPYENATVTFVEASGDKGKTGTYEKAVAKAGEPYHIVVVDGRNRVACAKQAAEHLTADGVIIWDNTDRPEYREGMDYLAQKGFKQIAFTGLAPVNSNRMETSVFYRGKNCLGI